MLWETGYVEVTDLRTRLGPGKGKVMDPVKLWSGFVDVEKASKIQGFRQIQLWHDVTDAGVVGVFHLAVLGSDTADLVVVLSMKGDGEVDRMEVNLPRRNGRLLTSDGAVAWQAPSGEIHSSMSNQLASAHQLTDEMNS